MPGQFFLVAKGKRGRGGGRSLGLVYWEKSTIL
jgi:hypothetical protein